MASLQEIPDSTSSSLLERVRIRDPEAWHRLAEVYGPLVYYWCRKWGQASEDSADITQDVFRSVFAGIADFRKDRVGDSFRGWLRTITRNKVRDLIRRRATEIKTVCGIEGHEDFVAAPMSDVDEPPAIRFETQLLFRRALELIRLEFEQNTWQAFWQTAVEEVPPRDVAQAIGINVLSVYQAKSRVLKRLREEFEGLL